MMSYGLESCNRMTSAKIRGGLVGLGVRKKHGRRRPALPAKVEQEEDACGFDEAVGGLGGGEEHAKARRREHGDDERSDGNAKDARLRAQGPAVANS